MARIEKAVFDTGPPLHLHEVEALSLIELVQKKYITHEIERELSSHHIPIQSIKNIFCTTLSLHYKNIAKLLAEEYDIDLGESTGIALAQQEKIPLFFTDDLDARETAKRFHLEVHGTLGVILRSLREKYIKKEQAIAIVQQLAKESSLFLTSDLIDWIIQEIKRYKY
jgi:predicted nucleic acid-binding protein